MEIIGNAPSWADFAKAAAATGQVDEHGIPITGGPLAGGGSWAYNAVGTVYQPTGATQTDPFGNPQPVMAPLPGVWARVRINGDASTLPAQIAVWRAHGITVYEWTKINGVDCWSADGVTPAPDYVKDIGVIA